MKDVDGISDILLALLMLVGGEPARGEELAALLYSNTYCNRREVYLYNGMITLITDYEKTRSIKGASSPVVRTLDDLTSSLFFSYITFIRPIYNQVATSIASACPDHHHLFVHRGGKLASASISTKIKPIFLEHVKCMVGLRDYRQGLIAIQTFLWDSKPAFLRHVLPLDSQAGHSRAIKESWYANPSNEAFFDLGTLKLHQFLACSYLWHEALHLKCWRPPFINQLSSGSLARSIDSGEPRESKKCANASETGSASTSATPQPTPGIVPSAIITKRPIVAPESHTTYIEALRLLRTYRSDRNACFR